MTTEKAEACRRADAETRRLNAYWKADREGLNEQADVLVALAALSAAGLKPGDGVRFAHHPVMGDVVLDYGDALIGLRDPHDPPPSVSPQDRLKIEILRGAPIPRTRTDAKDKHFELVKGPKNKVGRDQFVRAWNVLLDISGDITVEHLRLDHPPQDRPQSSMGWGYRSPWRRSPTHMPSPCRGVWQGRMANPDSSDSGWLPMA
jgi:hypothetical protein